MSKNHLILARKLLDTSWVIVFVFQEADQRMCVIRIPNLEAAIPSATGLKSKKSYLFFVAIALGLLMLLLVRDGTRFKNGFAGTNSSADGPAVLWHDPGAVELLDFAAGPGGNENR